MAEMLLRCLITLLLSTAGSTTALPSPSTPEPVNFPSDDAKTTLIGYLYLPKTEGPHPAIVLLHGRSGPYSSKSGNRHDATTLSARHRMWGRFWSDRGYAALLVDSFGPRGYPRGFGLHSYKNRPASVSEQTVRPLDALGALRYLKTRKEVAPDRIGVQGWSNGAMSILSLIGRQESSGFRAALAFYPSCRAQAMASGYQTKIPLLLLSGSNDAEVSAEICRKFSESAKNRFKNFEFVLYPGAQHAFDDPGKKKQSHAPNQTALVDSKKRSEAYITRHLGTP